MGRVLVSLTRDDCGWHDPLSGPSTPQGVRSRYGVKTYHEARNDFYKSARDSFLSELGKYGLDERDLVMCVNFFSKVTADADGRLRFHEHHCHAGMTFELRAEMNTLVILNTCVHPLDPNPEYSPQRARLTVWSSPPPGPDDECRISCPENKRGFEITERYFL
jgi:urea carboxylase-associated protein 2